MWFNLTATTTIDNGSTELIIWGICIGVSLGFVINFLTSAISGSFVRALLEKNAIGEEKAATLNDIGYLNKWCLKLLLRDGSALRNTVSIVGGKLPTISAGGKTATDYTSARFYISSDKREKASSTYGNKEKWYFLVIFIVLAIGCAFGMTKVMPLLVDALF